LNTLYALTLEFTTGPFLFQGLEYHIVRNSADYSISAYSTMAESKVTFLLTVANGGLGAKIVPPFLASPYAAANKALFAVRSPSLASIVVRILNKAPSSKDHESHEIITTDLGALAGIRAAADEINYRVASGKAPLSRHSF